MIAREALDGVIFDMDGLIVDSEPFWRQVEADCFARHGADIWPFLGHGHTMGLRVDEAVAYLCRAAGLVADEGALVEEIVSGMVAALADRSELLPGARDAIEAFSAAGLPLALASGSTPPVIEAVLDRFGLRDAFAFVASAADDELGKPHPSIFLRAAAALGALPTRTLVLEDSLNGVIAAKAARMLVLAVPASADATDPRYALADWRIRSLTELPAVWDARARSSASA